MSEKEDNYFVLGNITQITKITARNLSKKTKKKKQSRQIKPRFNCRIINECLLNGNFL